MYKIYRCALFWGLGAGAWLIFWEVRSDANDQRKPTNQPTEKPTNMHAAYLFEYLLVGGGFGCGGGGGGGGDAGRPNGSLGCR